MSVLVQTEKFSGPLALLLHLIRREEMDIFDINVHQITKQYLDYIRAMKKLDLEVAGDFIAMAATLIQVKSRMLLPSYDENGEEIESDDPRKELVQKLLDYQKYQEAAQGLYERPLLGRDLWARGQRLHLVSDAEEEIIVEDNALFSLIRSYRSAVKNMKNAVHRVAGEMKSVSDKILELRDRLVMGVKTTFFGLLPERKEVNEVVITFLSLLELTRMGFLSLFQSENFADIHITAKKDIDGDVVSRAESFESNTQDLAEDVDKSGTIAVPEDIEFDDDAIDEVQENEVDGESVEEKLSAQFDSEVLDEEEEEYDPLVEAATDEEIEAEVQAIEGHDLNSDEILEVPENKPTHDEEPSL